MLNKKRFDLLEEPKEVRIKEEPKEVRIKEEPNEVRIKEEPKEVKEEQEEPKEVIKQEQKESMTISKLGWNDKLFVHYLLKNTLNVNGDFDTLFWSVFIAHYGMSEYSQVKKYGNKEMEEKTNMTTFLHKMEKTKRKECTNYKITNVFATEIISDIMTYPKMPIYGLIPLCIFYKKNIYVVDWKKRTYLSFLTNESTHSIILVKNPLKHMDYFVDDGSIIPLTFLQNYFIMLNHYEKTLKGITTYKMEDLEMMNQKLPNPFEQLKKTELYEKLLLHCVWK